MTIILLHNSDTSAATVNGEIGDGEFQTVAPKSARRKEKLLHHREHPKEHHRRERLPRGRSSDHSSSSKDLHNRDKENNLSREHHTAVRENSKEDKSEDSDSQQPVKYVEAPLPVVNPWNKSKQLPLEQQKPAAAAANATQPQPQQQQQQQQQVPSSSSTAAQVNVMMDSSSSKVLLEEREKRVLQPQMQRPKIGNYNNIFFEKKEKKDSYNI